AQARSPLAVDRPHQRRGARERALLQPAGRRTQGRRGRGRSQDPGRPRARRPRGLRPHRGGRPDPGGRHGVGPLRADLAQLREAALAEIAAARTPAELEAIRVRYLGRKGSLNAVLRGLGALAATDRPALGALANQVKDAIQAALAAREGALGAAELARSLGQDRIDVTLPGRERPRGHVHPLRQVEDEIVEVFVAMGFRVAEGPETGVRFRPSFFPFTEPSAEVDIACTACAAAGRAPDPACRVCHGGGWLEILGAGMIHPNVLRAGGYDPEALRGFAFGMGTDRVALLRYGLTDLRLFYDNDLRFLGQFPF